MARKREFKREAVVPLAGGAKTIRCARDFVDVESWESQAVALSYETTVGMRLP
jgi:hypothetical protein